MSQTILCSILLVAVIALGILSRVFKLNNEIWDHYLGDALYAVMFFLILTLLWSVGDLWQRLILTSIFMLIIEFFQLTNIPLSLFESKNSVLKIIGILLGTKFSWYEILAYFVGLGIAGLVEILTKSFGR